MTEVVLTTDYSKPFVYYDFWPGHMNDRLTPKALDALRRVGKTAQAASLQQEMMAYMRRRGNDPEPTQMLPIIQKYVNVMPSDFRTAEKIVGKKMARQLAPRNPKGQAVPQLIWHLLDLLTAYYPEQAELFYRDIFIRLQNGIWDMDWLLRVAAKWRSRIGVPAFQVYEWASEQEERTTYGIYV